GVAHGGQVLLSGATAALVTDALVDGVTLSDLGEQRLRDLSHPMDVYPVRERGLPSDFPPLRTVDLVPTNLPTQRTELIGRADDISARSELVERTPLVPLTGVGGVGKTRLAIGLAASLGPGCADGCWLVELAPVADGSEVVKTVASAIGAPATDLSALVAYL